MFGLLVFVASIAVVHLLFTVARTVAFLFVATVPIAVELTIV